MKTVIENTIDILKDKKILFEIDEELITLYFGSFTGYLQFEKLEEDEDYNLLQTWIRDEFDEELCHEYILEEDDRGILTKNFIEGEIDNLIIQNKIFTSTISKIRNLFERAYEIVEENELPNSIIYDLFKEILKQ